MKGFPISKRKKQLNALLRSQAIAVERTVSRITLFEKLLAIGGQKVTFRENDFVLTMVATKGKQLLQPVQTRDDFPKKGGPHFDAALFWMKYVETAFIGTGFALNDDGIWQSHSWVMMDDHIIEMTEPKKAYYGIQLNQPDSLFFWSIEMGRTMGLFD